MGKLREIKFISSGKYLPKRVVNSSEIDTMIGVEAGTVEKTTQIKSRHYACVETEPVSKMGAWALNDALEKLDISINDLDAVICSSGTGLQEIPYTASMVLHEYEKEFDQSVNQLTSFDINATCMSFMQALDVASSLLSTGRYKKIALISTENASNGLDYKSVEVSGLFGDGAVAFIAEFDESSKSGVEKADFWTYPKAARVCQIEGGGSGFHAKNYEGNEEKFHFQMNGKRIFKLALETVPGFMKNFLDSGNYSIQENIDYVIPHQASASSLKIMQRKLDIPVNKWANIIENHGNMISVSIPLSLHYAIESKKVKRGDRILLIGTSAGYSVGSVVFKY